MKSLIKIAAVIVVLAVIGYFFLVSSVPEVGVVPVERGTAVDASSGNLRIFSANSLVLRSDLPGRVLETITPPNSGPVPVKAGDVVVQLDPVDIKRELELAKVRLEAAKRRDEVGSAFDAPIADARADIELQQELVENEQFPEADLEKSKRLLSSLALQLEQERAQRREDIAFKQSEVDRLETQLKRLSVVSPFDGYVTEIISPTGDLVSNGTPVARVISNENIIEVSLSEEDFKNVFAGQSVTARLLSQGQTFYSGKIETILAEADPETRRRSIYISLDAPDEVLVPGTTGQASITKAALDNVLVVPRRALLGSSVYVVDNGFVQKREVETGFMGLNAVEIKEGLREGELVIVDTPHLYRVGESVEAVASKTTN